MSNLVTRTNKPKFSVAIQSDTYKNLINQTLGDKDRATRFIASISSAVATNQALQECDAGTILSGALLGESLNLSPSPQLGQYYLVPFNPNSCTNIFQNSSVSIPFCQDATPARLLFFINDTFSFNDVISSIHIFFLFPSSSYST